MAKHGLVLDHFRSAMHSFDKENPSHRQGIMDILLHAADLGNPTLKFDLATVWSLRVIQEFNNQV